MSTNIVPITEKSIYILQTMNHRSQRQITGANANRYELLPSFRVQRFAFPLSSWITLQAGWKGGSLSMKVGCF